MEFKVSILVNTITSLEEACCCSRSFQSHASSKDRYNDQPWHQEIYPTVRFRLLGKSMLFESKFTSVERTVLGETRKERIELPCRIERRNLSWSCSWSTLQCDRSSSENTETSQTSKCYQKCNSPKTFKRWLEDSQTKKFLLPLGW